MIGRRFLRIAVQVSDGGSSDYGSFTSNITTVSPRQGSGGGEESG